MTSLPFSVDPRETLPYDGSAVLHVDFLRQDEADRAFHDLLAEVPWRQHSITLFGKEVAEPRLSAWIADPGVSYLYSGRRREPLAWTSTLVEIRERASATAGSGFNSVLANLYRDGNDAMGWHADDEPELGPRPVIASVSLGAERRFDLRHNVSGETVSALLPHGSLLVMSGDSQHAWKHRIARTARVGSSRINLTFRSVIHE